MFKCIRNLTPRNIGVPHLDADVKSHVLGPYELEWLTDPDAWQESNPRANTLHQLIESKIIEIVDLDRRPPKFSVPDMTRNPSVRPGDIENMKTIVLSPKHEIAMMIINVEATTRTPDRTPDMDYLRKRLLPVLKGALETYKKHGELMKFPDRPVREKAINRRIKEIEGA